MPKKSHKNGAGEGSIRKRSNNRWEGRITTCYDGKTGRQTQKSIYGKTREEVSRKLTAIRLSLEEGTYREPSKMETGEWIKRWLENYARIRVKESTYENYALLARAYIIPDIGHIPLCRIKPIDLQQFYNRAAEKGRVRGSSDSRQGLSASMLKQLHNIIHRSLEQALKENMISSNPDDACALPHIQKRKINPIPLERLPGFLAEAAKGNHYAMLYLDLCTGLRRGELLGLKWKDIDFAKGTITVCRQLNRINGELKLTIPKTDNSGRTVPLPKSVSETLKKHRIEQNRQRQRVGGQWIENDFVFCNNFGAPLDPAGIYRYYKRLMDRLGLKEYRFHDLRHTFATIALQNGVDVKTLQEILGHSSAAFTLQVYGHMSHQMQQQAAEKIDGFLSSQAKNSPKDSP